MTWGLLFTIPFVFTVMMSTPLIGLPIQSNMIVANTLLSIITLFVSRLLLVILSFDISLLVYRLLIYLQKAYLRNNFLFFKSNVPIHLSDQIEGP